MKKNNFIKLLTLLTLTTNIIAAPNGIYLEVGIANSQTDSITTTKGNVSYKGEYPKSISIGYQHDIYRFELEGIFAENSLNSLGDFSTTGNFKKESKMLNFYYSGYNESRMISSIGAGFGLTDSKLNNLKQLNQNMADISDKNILSVQGMISLGYKITPHFINTIKYTYFYTKKSSNFNASNDNLFTISLRYIF